MNAQEIKATIASISNTKYNLETALEENGGELTPELLEQCDALEDMKALLAGEGIDDLGRWLKSVQDEAAALKAEADAAARKVKNIKSYEEYVKFLIGQALDAIGQEKVKGSFYGFTRTTSTKSSVLMDALDDAYLPMVEQIVRDAGLPSWIKVSIKATTTDLRAEGGDALAFLDEETSPALRFTKPRANREV